MNMNHERQRLQALADLHRASVRHQPSLADLAADAAEIGPTDDEILGVIMATFDMERDEALARLEAMDIANMWVLS